ncbi:MAG: hypothetical protein RDU89_02755 [bacterium]|nr:hypothetical protein [bacterium]
MRRDRALTRALQAWRVAAPTPGQTEELVALVRNLPRPGPFRVQMERERGARPSTGGSPLGILQLTLAQVGFFRPWFWLASLVTVAGGLAFIVLTGSSATTLLATLVPVLTALGVAHAFRAAGSGAWEVEMACPISPVHLTLGRLVVVVAYDILLGATASLVVWWGSPPLLLSALVLSWLTPLLLTASFALYLCVVLPLSAGAAGALAAGFWVAQVLVRRLGLGVSLFAGPGDPAWPLLQVVGLAVAGFFTLMSLRQAGAGLAITRARVGEVEGR